MDNLTHSLVGWTIAEAGLKHRSRKGLAACVLAANMPDIDVFFGWVPWAPLAMHRGFTHGLVGGVLLMPPLLAELLWCLDRWQVLRGVTFRSGLPMRFGWLVALSYLGALTHPLLDLQNVYAVQLLSPLSSRWFHTDGLFIVDPWLWGVLVAGIALSRRWSRTGPARGAFATMLAYIGLNIGLSQMAAAEAHGLATRSVPGRAAPVVDRLFSAPEPLLFWRRDVLLHQSVDGKGSYRRLAFDPLSAGSAALSVPQVDGINDPLVQRASKASAEVVDFLAWSQMPIARVERMGCVARVTFGDARFAGLRVAGSFKASASVPLTAPPCPMP